jgi:autotransporter-associated beta strand protein
MSNNAAIEAFDQGGMGGTNILDGIITIATNGTALMKLASAEHLVLYGPISGSGSNNAAIIQTNSTTASGSSSGNGGTLWLWGTNTYLGNTLVYQGFLEVMNSNAIPNNTTLWASNNTAAGSPFVVFGSNGIYNATKTLRVSTFKASAQIGGDATWLGPVFMHGSNGIVSIYGGSNGLYLAGSLISTNQVAVTNLTATNFTPALAGSIQFHGVNTRIKNPLNLAVADPNLNIAIGQGDGESKGFNENFTTLELDSPNNWKVINVFERGQAIMGADNAFGTNVIIVNVGTLSAGVLDRRVTFDLNGHNQSISYMREAARISLIDTIGNSSTNSDSLLTYAGIGINTWMFNLVDTNNQVGTTNSNHKLALSVTSGTLELYNTNTYTGPTTVSGGTLLLETYGTTNINPLNNLTNYGSLGATAVTVNGGGVFGGNGSVGGDVTINAGGTLTPGDLYSFNGFQGYPNVFTNALLSKIGGPLTMNGGTLTLNPGSTTIFDVDNFNAINDQVAGVGTVIMGGTFVMNNVSVAPYVSGQAIPLFQFQASTNIGGTLPAITPAYPGNHLVWDTSTLLTDGNLRLATLTTNPPVPVITRSVSGGNLTLSWPADHTGWTLQAQTNALNKGLKMASTNWFNIPSSVNTNSMTIPIGSTNPTVFYRLMY